MSGVPLILLSHRKDEFLPRALRSIRERLSGVGEIIIVDDSGDADHINWLDEMGESFTVVDIDGNAGYLKAMETVFEVARDACDLRGSSYAVLWEEDFILRRKVSVEAMIEVLEAPENSGVAQLNFQRQPVYKVEKRLGYMESHMRRGYNLKQRTTNGRRWVSRAKPFTTNPGVIRRDVLDEVWPSRETADQTSGGAEPAMSRALERNGWSFGWYGPWNTAVVQHVGDDMKTGTGY